VRVGLAFIGVLTTVAILAPLLAPNSPTAQFDEGAGRHLPPMTSKIGIRLNDGRGRLADGIEVGAEGVEIERLGRIEFIPFEQMSDESRDNPTKRRFYLLGTDKLGRDVWARIAYGSRVSLAIGVLAALIALVVGTTVGAIAALSNRWLDGLLMRTVDGLLMFPRIFLLLAITAMIGGSTSLIVVVLGCTSWMSVSRLARAELLSLRRQDFVEAARSTGQKPLRIFLRHMLPGSISPVLIDTTLRIGDLILLEAALSYLGMGVPPPTPSWGGIVSDGAMDLVSAWWVSLFPGLAIAATVIAFNLIGDGLRDWLDPKSASDSTPR
jgi:peptide/nickel transport system permease protein